MSGGGVEEGEGGSVHQIVLPVSCGGESMRVRVWVRVRVRVRVRLRVRVSERSVRGRGG